MKKIIYFILFIGSFFICCGGIKAAPIIDDGIYEIKSALNNNMAIDVYKGVASNGTNVQLYTSNGGNNQKWIIKSLGNGYYSITTNLNKNVSLDVYGAKPIGPGTNVQLYASNGGDNQKWIIKDAGNGYYSIVSKYNNLYLDVFQGVAKNGANIQLYPYNGGNNQKFKLVKIKDIGTQTISDGTYTIQSALDNDMVLDIPRAVVGNSSNVQLYSSNDKDNQKWNIKYLGDGYYSIKSVLNNNFSLDVYGAKPIGPGTNIQLYSYNGGNNQKWIIKDAGDGNYYIISDCNNLYLDVYKGVATNGANIQLYTSNGGNNQKFKFVTTTPEQPKQTISDGTYVIQSALNNKMAMDLNRSLTNNGTNIQLYSYNGGNNEKWNVKHLGNGYYSITTSLSDNMSLDVYGAKPIGPGTNLQLYTFNGGDNQKWIIKDAGDGYYYLVSKGSGLYIDVSNNSTANGTNILMYSYNGGNNQKFKFVPTEVNTDVQTYSNGVYSIKSFLNTNKVIDINKGLRFEGTNILLYENGNKNNQLWYLSYVKDGYYSFTSALNKKLALTAENNGNIALYKYKGSDSQLWRLKDFGNGELALVSKASELYVSLSGDVAANNTNIVLAAGNSNNNQKFKLEKYTGIKVYKGIDVSVHNTVDWEKIANEGTIDFAIIRAGYGGNWTSQDDTKFKANVAACEKYNIPYGTYLYSYAADIDTPDKTGANEEAKHMLRLLNEIKVSNYSPTLGTEVFLDVEDKSVANVSKSKLTSVVNYFCSTIENNGYRCGVYASAKWLNEHLNAPELVKKFDIWLAQWPYGETTPVSYATALSTKPSYNTTSYKYWQFTSSGSSVPLAGINGRLDLDLGYDIFD